MGLVEKGLNTSNSDFLKLSLLSYLQSPICECLSPYSGEESYSGLGLDTHTPHIHTLYSRANALSLLINFLEVHLWIQSFVTNDSKEVYLKRVVRCLLSWCIDPWLHLFHLQSEFLLESLDGFCLVLFFCVLSTLFRFSCSTARGQRWQWGQGSV